jgi:hypothetical protein
MHSIRVLAKYSCHIYVTFLKYKKFSRLNKFTFSADFGKGCPSNYSVYYIYIKSWGRDLSNDIALHQRLERKTILSEDCFSAEF